MAQTHHTRTGDTMPASALPRTAEELLTYDAPDKQVELVRGQLIVREPPGQRHGNVAGRIYLLLALHLRDEQRANGWPRARGRLVVGDAGYILRRGPDTVRGPDVAYLSYDRYDGPLPDGFLELAPDLVVEVRSPGDHGAEVREKVDDWLDAGARVVWVVDPRRQEIVEHRADCDTRVLGAGDSLDGGSVLRGFAHPVADIFSDD